MSPVMRPRQLVVVGASAGGLEALRELASSLPANFPAAIAVVMHTAPESPGILRDSLDRAGELPAVSPTSGERLEAGHIYVAPSDFHLLIEPGRIRIARGPKENRFRPAIDPLFRTAAQVYGPNAIGIVLTGNLDDGAAGLWAIKQLGGVAIVQHPADALFPSMPESALAYVNVDYVARLDEIGPLLVRLTAAPALAPHAEPAPAHLEIETRIAKQEDPLQAGITRIGDPSQFACPECHGVLREVNGEGRLRFRCHTGHAYSMESLLADISEQIEVQVWNAIRAMQEGHLLMCKVAEHVGREHPSFDIGSLQERAAGLQRQTETLRKMVTSEPTPELAETGRGTNA